MPTVIEDLVAGHEYETGKDADTLVRAFKVIDLERGPGILIDAVAAVGIDYLDKHPADDELLVVSRKAMPVLNSRTQAKVVVTYKSADTQGTTELPPEGVVRFHGSTRSVLTNRTWAGDLITVVYTPPGATFNADRDVQIGEIETTRAYGILEYEQDVTENPESFLDLVNTTNEAPFRGGEKWTWWCSDLDIEYFIRREKFRVAVRLDYDPDTYVKPVFWTDPVTGKVPGSIVSGWDKDADTGSGYANILQYRPADFDRWGIP